MDDAGAPLLIDSHGSRSQKQSGRSIARVIDRAGAIATLIEWDNDVPDWPTLARGGDRGTKILADASRASAA